MSIDWNAYPNFSPDELRCSHTGLLEINPASLARLQRLRDEYGAVMPVTSGYRHPSHPIEAAKPAPGPHTTGQAFDIRVMGGGALRLVALAVKHGFTGIGIQQKGAGRFVHLDDLTDSPGRPRPWIWSY